MKTILKTDFIDIYDHHFDSLSIPEPHNQFLRMSKDSVSRDRALDYLRTEGFDTVKYGSVQMMGYHLKPDDLVVVYTDPFAHRGIGKELMTLDMAEFFYPDALVSEYIGQFKSVSMKDLFIGSRKIRMIYKSDHEWKSNVGNVDIKLYSYEYVYTRPFIHLPMVSVDYVFDGEKQHYAIDFNTSTIIKGSPVTDIMSEKDIVAEIKKWYERKV